MFLHNIVQTRAHSQANNNTKSITRSLKVCTGSKIHLFQIQAQH